MIKAECTWGEGPDVLLILKDEEYGFMLYKAPQHMHRAKHGYMTAGSMDLTKEQARALASSLMTAVEHTERIERELEEYMKQEKEGGTS